MYKYYDMYKNSKQPEKLRIEMIEYAKANGISKAAREFNTTRNTVKKWLRRYDEAKVKGLKDQSKKPKNSPKKIDDYCYCLIKQVCEIAIRDNKRINGAKIKKKYKIPYSDKTVVKYMKRFGYLKVKKQKTDKKRDMRNVKELYRAFHKTQIDIKYLDDIPEMYFAYKQYGLPRYQITARCVRTGALFFWYTNKKSVQATATFLMKFFDHLQKHGVNLSECHIQTDNGTEFASTWNTTKKTLFTKIIEQLFDSAHKTIPPGAKTYQSDVETSHRLIEDEFYACEYFYSRKDFLEKAQAYQRHFNFERFNTYKKGTPKEILQKISNLSEKVLDFKPEIVDNYFDETLERCSKVS